MDPSVDSTKLQIPCRNLRSKEMYYLSPGQPEDEYSGGAYWCEKTCENFGPDGQPVSKSDCCAARPCYVG